MTYKKLQVVMLPTNEKSRLQLTKEFLNLAVESFVPYGKQTICQHLYFLSNEEIKEGDWYLYWFIGETLEQSRIGQSKQNGFVSKSPHKKIVATTDISLTVKQYGRGEQTSFFPLPQPPDSFLELYTKEYNAGRQIKEVLVKYEDYYPLKQSTLVGQRLFINKDNAINIKSVKDSWSKEEVIALTHQLLSEHNSLPDSYSQMNNKELDDYHKDWIGQNL